MRKRKSVVRVVIDDPSHGVRLLLEQFRYMGHVQVHHDDTKSICFDVYPPAKVNEDSWCSMNASRMCSFGLNAVVAPAWADMTSAEKDEVEGRVPWKPTTAP